MAKMLSSYHRWTDRLFSGTAVSTLSLSVVVSGCAASPLLAPEPTLGEVRIINTPQDIVLPRHAYQLSDDIAGQLANSQVKLINKCLREAGEPGDISSFENLSDAIESTKVNHRYISAVWGQFDPQSEKYSGFASRFKGQYTLSPSENNPEKISKCLNDVIQKMPYKKMWEVSLDPFSAFGDSNNVSPSDSRLSEINKKWSDCMKAEGYDYASPLEARQRNLSTTVNAEGTKISSTDIACKQKTDFMTQAVAIQSAYDKQFVEKHRNELDQFKKTISDFIQANS